MLAELDHGTRCERHVGEAFRVRCYDCDQLATAAPARDLAYLDSPVNCSPEAPCDRCIREAATERTT